jgi:ABC-type sugar transport system ATPase subunit
MALMCSGLITLLFRFRDRLLAMAEGVVEMVARKALRNRRKQRSRHSRRGNRRAYRRQSTSVIGSRCTAQRCRFSTISFSVAPGEFVALLGTERLRQVDVAQTRRRTRCPAVKARCRRMA